MEIIMAMAIVAVLITIFSSAGPSHIHEWQYDGDDFSQDDKHYGKYFKCKFCGKEKFISNTEFMNMEDKDMDFWANRPWTKIAKNKKKNKTT